ncbi:MAG: YdcH family protein [Psychromonas sp.]
MLNENHALILDFPELKNDIVQLTHKDPLFKQNSQQYHTLDYEIRQLEISGSPTDDGHMHQLKQQRALLKDLLYEQLKAHQNSLL